ncbi:hybrid sensor histidine kinase/response regulator [Parafilimonas sp.]|uniref:hybrid sensor histidine kinase/response regulator n=1 Tax=Parafilimonas sp. TaxID=1969739 RepID=UPI0039E489D8
MKSHIMFAEDKKIRVLYIDDELNNLLAFQAGFRRKYKIFIASSAAEGIGILNDEKDIHVIICDQRMPQSTGVEFFHVVRKAFPDPVRILLTGYTDAEAIINAINEGEIFRYIKKPWDEFELQNAVQNAFELYTTRLQLKRKVNELQKTNDELNRFVYSTSHDLRSPLASAMGIINLARMENSVTDPNNYLGMIETCVNKMDAFIQKIIEYYKSIRVEDEHSSIDFESMLAETIAICRMQKPSVEFVLNVDQQMVFFNDPFRVSIIMDNLLSNAVKYSNPNSNSPKVEVTVKVDEYKAQVEIADNGIGIVEEHLNNIFKMFFRSTTHVNGLGIGLYIVKEALSRIGGDISVASAYGMGTTFHIMIPNFKKQKEDPETN